MTIRADTQLIPVFVVPHRMVGLSGMLHVLRYVPCVNTLDNEADLFTKPLIPRLFYPLRDALMNVPISDSEILAMGGRGNTGGRVPQGVVARSA